MVNSISICFTLKTCVRGALKNKTKVLLLLKFFFFNVFLVSMDILMDTWTGVDLVRKGHFYWGLCTLALQAS